MIESSMMVNDKMPEYTVDRASKILNRHKKSLNGSKVLVLGIAYKNNIDDYRESPALEVIEILKETGAITEFYDPWISEYKYKDKIHEGIDCFDADVVKKYDLIVIATGHTNIDYNMVQENAVAIFDTRNAMIDITNRENIELL